MINLRQKHSTWNPNWTHTLALPFPRPILSLQISRSDRIRNIFQHIKSVISRKLLASACHTHKANLFFARLSGHLCLAEKVPSSYLPGASVIEALRSCLPHVSLRLLPTHSTSPASSSRANKRSREYMWNLVCISHELQRQCNPVSQTNKTCCDERSSC